MFSRKRRTTEKSDSPVGHEFRETHVPKVRGGVSFGAILTGVVVAFGAMLLLSALIGGILAAIGTSVEEVTAGDAVDAGVAVGISFVVATFLAYLWGGYTAGRMGRGAGPVNGLLVPVVALVLAVAVGAIVSALGATAQLNLPFSTSRLPVDENSLVDFGTGIGIATLVAMFLGALLGGMMGSRWHTKLERRVVERRVADERGPARSTASDEERAAEERRRLSERASQRREQAPTREQPPAREPVVTRHNTTEERPRS